MHHQVQWLLRILIVLLLMPIITNFSNPPVLDYDIYVKLRLDICDEQRNDIQFHLFSLVVCHHHCSYHHGHHGFPQYHPLHHH
jgi:hypothetical protein